MSDRSARKHGQPRAAHAPAGERRVPPFEDDGRAFARLVDGATRLHTPGVLERGLELRHVRRLVQPVVDAVFAGRDLVAFTAEPTDRAATRAAHTAVLAVRVAAELGLARPEAADLGVVALLHGVARTEAGVRRLLGGTTWSALALELLQCALARTVTWDSPLVAQVVAVAAEYVVLSARALEDETGEALENALRAAHQRWHPEITAALTRVVTRDDEREQERPAA